MDANLDTVNAELVAVLRHAWVVCERLDAGPIYPGGPRAGVNLPELLSGALQALAAELGSTEALVRHRPGSWEAEHVRALGYLL